MNLTSLDLNLLVALQALLSEESVSRAAQRVGLSQPATSHALQRLRDVMGDPLLVRVGSRMELTPRAQALRAPLAEALAHVQGLFVADTFEPAVSQRRFSLMMPDHVLNLILPPLRDRIRAEAPGVRADVAPWRGPGVMTAEFARTIDLVIGCTGAEFPGFHGQRLFSDTDAIAIRKDHPERTRIGQMEPFLSTPHVAVFGRGQREDPVDTWLQENGVERRIALAVPSYLQALHMVAGSDLVAVVPRRQIEALGRVLSLDAVRPPLDPGSFEEIMFHPTRAQVDPGSIWLRKHVLAIAAKLG